jgi:hypothetical protein
MLPDLAGIDKLTRHPGMFPHKKKIVSALTLLFIVNDEGEVVEGVCHHMADDDARPSSMATKCPTQIAVTWALVAKKVCGKIFLFIYTAD